MSIVENNIGLYNKINKYCEINGNIDYYKSKIHVYG